MHFAVILTFVKKLKVSFFHYRMDVVRGYVAEWQQCETTLVKTRMRDDNMLTFNNKTIAPVQNIQIHRTRHVAFMRCAAVTPQLLLYLQQLSHHLVR